MSKYDSFGRRVVAAAWAAISGIPATIAALADSSPGGSGTNMWVDNGEGAWAPITGGAPPIGGQVTAYMSADVDVSTSYVYLFSDVPVTPGAVYAAHFEDEWVTSSVGTVTTAIISEQEGSITPIGDGIDLFVNTGGGLNGNGRNIASSDSDAQIWSTHEQQVTMSGVFSVSDTTTSVALAVEVNTGSMTAKAGGYMILTRLA